MTETSIDYHPENINRFERFAELSGLEVQDPSERIDRLKSATTEHFLDLLSVTNGLVRGQQNFTRWPGKAALSTVSMNGITDIHPPEDAHEEFGAFFDNLKESIRGPEDIDRAAVETYFAIIGSHMFAEGNGRTARAAYELIKNGKVPDNQAAIIKRQKNSVNAAQMLNVATIRSLFIKEGYKHGEEFDNVDDLAADDRVTQEEFFVLPGLDSQLKYIAARRVMERAGVWGQRGSSRMGLKGWPKNRLGEYQEEYAKVRSEWFREFTSLAGQNTEFFVDKLDEGVNRSIVQDDSDELVAA